MRLSSFERKQYDNFSHEPNKAMNLNSYIGVIGKCFGDVATMGVRASSAPGSDQTTTRPCPTPITS